MGSQAWGGDGEWGGDQGWGGNDWGYQQGYEPQGYLRSLASLDNVPTIPTKHAFDSLADHSAPRVDVIVSSVEVPTVDLIVPARRVRNKTRHKKKLMSVQCENDCKCSGSHSSSTAGPGRLPPTPLMMGGNQKPLRELIDNNDPELATAWKFMLFVPISGWVVKSLSRCYSNHEETFLCQLRVLLTPDLGCYATSLVAAASAAKM